MLKRFVPVLALAAVACEDPLIPVVWVATPDTIVMYSASRAEHVNRASVLDLTSDPVAALPLEVPGLTGNWDFVLTDSGSGLALTPAITFVPTVPSRARIGRIDGPSFDALDEAPRDTTSYTAQPVLLQEGRVYVLRSRVSQCGFQSGQRYAKMTPFDVDVTRGIVRMVVVRNPFCDDRALVPPGD